MKKGLYFLLFFCSHSIYGQSVQPYFNLSSQVSPQNPWIADLRLPLLNTVDNYFFADFTAAYSPRNYTYSLNGGGLIRYIPSPESAWGSYLYFSQNRSLLKKLFFTANPGVEFLNKQWHLSVNGYLPVNSTHQGSGDFVWADEVGIYKYIRFTQHVQYNQKVQLTSSTGLGVDGIVSYRIQALANTKFSAGMYYFNMPSYPVGFVARMESPLFRRISFNLGFSHDPLTKNSVFFGIKAHFGGQSNPDWINQPVQHNLPLATQANTIPIETGYRSQGLELLQKDNIWFFQPFGSPYNNNLGLANCTYENPCSGLNSETTLQIAQIAPTGNFQNLPSLYLSPGTYPSPELILFGSESLSGRSANYIFPARRDERANIVTGRLIINGLGGNQTNTVADVIIHNNGSQFVAINLFNIQTVYINNVQIGASDPLNLSTNFAAGLFVNNSQNVYINNSVFDVNNYATGNAFDIGVMVIDGVEHLFLENTQINGLLTNSNRRLIGMELIGHNNISINQSQFHQSTTGTDSSSVNITNSPGNSGELLISNSRFLSITSGNNSSAANLLLRANITGTIHQSIFTANTSSTDSNLNAINVQLNEQAQLHLNNSLLDSSGISQAGTSSATNIFLFDNSVLSLNNTDLNSFGQSALVTGSTNLTLEDNARASIQGGTLNVSMAGGPPGVEPSGAVSIWMLNNSSISISNAMITARSCNAVTGSVAIQSQNQSTVVVENSDLSSYYDYGNASGVSASTLVAANDAMISVNNSTIKTVLRGDTDFAVATISAINNSRVSISNSVLQAINSLNWFNPNAKTLIALAGNSAIIRLNSNDYYLFGPNRMFSDSQGNGEVIITN